MKKIIIMTLFCFMGVLNGYSQTEKMSAAELNFRSGVEKFLKEEGFFPTIDDDDNSLNFKKEGERYWLTVEDNEPYYIRLHKVGYTTKTANRKILLEACNNTNMNIRCGKACALNESVSFIVEFYCYSLEGFKNTFYNNMRAVDRVKSSTSEYYNEHDK